MTQRRRCPGGALSSLLSLTSSPGLRFWTLGGWSPWRIPVKAGVGREEEGAGVCTERKGLDKDNNYFLHLSSHLVIHRESFAIRATHSSSTW